MRHLTLICVLAALPVAAQTSGHMNGSGGQANYSLGAKVGVLDNEIVQVRTTGPPGKGITSFHLTLGPDQGGNAPFIVEDSVLNTLMSVSKDGDLSPANQKGIAFYNSPASSSRFYSALSGVEGGADSGSDYVIRRYSDAGGFLGTPVYIIRSTGLVGINMYPTRQLDVGGTLGASPGGSVPAWAKYALVKIANGVNGCASANGCWQVNGVLGAAAAANLTQDIVLFQLPARGFVDAERIKSNVACTGPASVAAGLGVAGTVGFFRTRDYDVQAVVSNTNLTNELTNPGSTTAAAINVEANLVTTVQNVDQIADGCAVDYWVKWGVLP